MIDADQIIGELKDKVAPLVAKHGLTGFIGIPMKQGFYESVSLTSVRNLCHWTKGRGSMAVHTLEVIDKMASAIIDHDNGKPPY